MKSAFKIFSRLALALIFAAACFATPKSARADRVQADAFIADLGDRAIHALADDGLSGTDKTRKFRELLLEGFDIKTLSRFAVGRYWRKASKAQRKEYRGLFTEYILQTYTARFSQYSGEKLKVIEHRTAGKKDILVKSQLIRPQGEPVQIDWRVRQRKDKFLIIDIIVEGVSMAITQRDEFSSVIRRGGGGFDNLIALLKDKISSK